jgi:lysyl-tRNA synthetase class 2
MNSSSGLRFLRPYLHNEITVSSKAAYIRFFNSTRCLSSVSNSSPVKPASVHHGNVEVAVPFQVQERMKELKSVGALAWPRMQRDSNAVSIHTFIEEFSHLKPGEHLKNVTRTTRGRWHVGNIGAPLTKSRAYTKHPHFWYRTCVPRYRTRTVLHPSDP